MRWDAGPAQPFFNDALIEILTGPEILDTLRVFTTDKDLAKICISDRVGADYVIPTFAILRSREEIAAYAFPTRCVIKPTQCCGQVIMRKDGAGGRRTRPAEAEAEFSTLMLRPASR